MADVGIRALKQNASAVVARVSAGEVLTVTDRGRPVALLSPLPASPVERALATGLARMPRRRLEDLGPPTAGPELSSTLQDMRDAERY